MHYLDGLAERLVAAFEDEENLNDWRTVADRSGQRHALVQSVRRVLSREIASGRLAFRDPSSDAEAAASSALLLHEDWV